MDRQSRLQEDLDEARYWKKNYRKKIVLEQSRLKAAEEDKSDYNKEKISHEKRLEGIKAIIAMLEGTSAKNNVPSAINTAQAASETAGTTFAQCIVCSGITAASVSSSFGSKKVDSDTNLSFALEELKKQERLIENQIAELDKTITDLENSIATINSNIKSYTQEYDYYDSEVRRINRLL